LNALGLLEKNIRLNAEAPNEQTNNFIRRIHRGLKKR